MRIFERCLEHVRIVAKRCLKESKTTSARFPRFFDFVLHFRIERTKEEAQNSLENDVEKSEEKKLRKGKRKESSRAYQTGGRRPYVLRYALESRQPRRVFHTSRELSGDVILDSD